ncbi:MAG TPA: M1 family aminopeptidase [Anaerolineae bacterium]|nr:M1 family aminopeptidase [Anaerolineae bacterium]
MARLGQVLREARERKGCSWREIEAATGLWPEYVQALERENPGRFTSAGHFRSALRLYARYLGLDVREVLSLWERAAARPGRDRGEPPARGTGVAYRTAVAALVISLSMAICGITGLYGYRWLRALGGPDGDLFSIWPGGTAPLASPSVLPSPTPYSPISSTSVPRYVITATVDYEGHSLAVQERIDYANRSGETLNDVVLNVFPNHQPDLFALNHLSLEFGTGPMSTTHTLEGMALSVPLPQELEPGRVATLFLEFSLQLPYIDPQDSFTSGAFGWSDSVLDLGHWYPALAPLLPGVGWRALGYHPVGDPYVMEEADYDVRIWAPEGVTVVGGGELEREGNLWHYRLSQARSFGFAASDQYVSSSTEIAGATVTSYYLPEHEGAGVDVARFAAEALEVFEEEFGVPYPYADYRVAETEFAGGMEFSGLAFLGSLWYETYPGGVRCQLIALLVHEVSHQWWYGLVGSDQVSEPWLDEALATYSELLFYRLRYPDDHLWAWDFEVFNRQPAGAIDQSIYDFSDQASYMNAVYRRGALFLGDLRQTIGEEEFRQFLQDYAQSQAHTISTEAEFFSILSRHTNKDFSPLLEEYFARPPGEETT